MRSAADSSGVNATPPSPAFAAGAGLRCNPVVISYTSVSRPYGVGVPGSSMRGENGLPAASAAAAVLITPTAVAAGSGGSVVPLGSTGCATDVLLLFFSKAAFSNGCNVSFQTTPRSFPFGLITLRNCFPDSLVFHSPSNFHPVISACPIVSY